MPSLHDTDDLERGLQDQDAAASATEAATAIRPPPASGPELVDDDHGPAPPVASTGAAAAEKPAAKQRAGAPGLKTSDDGAALPFHIADDLVYLDPVTPDMPCLSVLSEKPAAAKKKKGVEVVDDGSAPPSTHASSGSMLSTKGAAPGDSATNPGPDASDDVERPGSQNASGMVRHDEDATTEDTTRESFGIARDPAVVRAPNRTDRGDSAIRIPEAWAVDDDNEDAEEGGEEEVFLATRVKPAVPWWKQKENRLYTWALLCLLSAIALAAFMTDEAISSISISSWHLHPGYAYIIACSAISLSLSAVASLAYVRNSTISRYFVGRKLEGVVSLLLAGLWSGSLYFILDPSNAYVDYAATISNFNLYFSSWGSLVCALVLFAMYVGERRRTPESIGLGYIARWCLLMLASLVVVIESTRFKNEICSMGEWGTRESTCVKNTLSFIAVITGCVGLVLSFSMSILSFRGRDSAFITAIIGLIMVVNYIVCAGAATFGDGPAEDIGNYSLAAWAGVFMSLPVFGGALKEYMKIRGREEVSQDAVNDNEAVP